MKSVPLWIFLYIPGMIAGMSGLMNLVKHSEGHKGVTKITIGFYLIVGLGFWVSFIASREAIVCQHDSSLDSLCDRLLIWPGWMYAFMIVAVFYSDLVLGMMTTNLVGVGTRRCFIGRTLFQTAAGDRKSVV